jgi:hypothetical protein
MSSGSSAMSSASNDNNKETKKTDIPTTKAGELYHKGAAIVSSVVGDDEGKIKHATLVKAKETKDKIDEGLEKAQERSKDNFESAKGNYDSAKQKAMEGFEYAEQTAEDGIDQAKETIDPAMDKVRTQAKGVFEGVKEYVAEKRDVSSSSSSSSSTTKSEIPSTVMDEFYHKQAAKVSDFLGDKESAKYHENLVEAKQAKDSTKENLENLEANLRNLGNNMDKEAKGAYGDVKTAFDDNFSSSPSSASSSKKSTSTRSVASGGDEGFFSTKSDKSTSTLTEDELARDEFKQHQMDWLDM